MHRGMADMMKAMGGGKARGPMAGLAQMMGIGGGMPSPGGDGEARREDAGRIAAGHAGAPPACREVPGLPAGISRAFPASAERASCPDCGGFPGLGKKK